MADNIRIGDTERDEAVSLLQEHHAAGRLSTDEFEERMGGALGARFASDLTVLFDDLPGRKPGEADLNSGYGAPGDRAVSPVPGSPTAYGAGLVPPIVYGGALTPRDNQQNLRILWWIVPVIVIGVLVGVMAAPGTHVVFPFVSFLIVMSILGGRRAQRRNLQQGQGLPPLPPRPLTVDGRAAILDLLRIGEDARALALYKELTLADENSATLAVLALRREIGR